MPAALMTDLDVDFIEEIRLRTWARENYVGPDDRNEAWHPVVLEEMRRKELELNVLDGSVVDGSVVDGSLMDEEVLDAIESELDLETVSA